MKGAVSSTERYLKGKKYPGFTSPVRSVIVSGQKRLIQLRNGKVIQKTKAQLTQDLHKVLSAEQFKQSLSTIRKQPDGSYTAKVGGLERGHRITYKTRAFAISGLRRRYKQ